ncbi:bifunctional 4-hydroxy-2-oxoglutarate aldolase/2-dehydro-3-deoxy-phosphogluconate aldolase [Collinsella tanakaei]|uniref:bifunctional 4-hydroxy-2-oxoglutarate aldolase/2-dehydro-3-deoxy-phosphogluconate aldolase n=1 Tax=Collinsella tanakaei TaxID=626935 RepID=UPI00195E5D41|nr:bifunctional 4-hydroxy-2-oxoglutarate aldolase/2-dehydro-3-deoxy-phosphogluconate aldolase [Collinsella tanakaei]MBM6756827.1 bifunctional 4-hydroxy-2-oxoglutarate aldolase/2-dehydro-3-deoxy-phosphogluconate aldolase [Collinsella tanakaei]
MFESFYAKLEHLGIVPVVVLEKVEDAAPLAHALMAAGMASAEVTFRTPVAAECIAAMAAAEPDMCVGAGTVLNVEQADRAIAAGAQFIVSPGFNEDVVRHCIEHNVPVLPGTVTPTEVTAAVNLGLKVTKFFPAAQYGGLSTIKALAAPFVGHRFMPTGGVSTKNVEEYLSCPSIIACGGTWMVKPALFADGDFSEVQRIATEAMEVVAKVRG